MCSSVDRRKYPAASDRSPEAAVLDPPHSPVAMSVLNLEDKLWGHPSGVLGRIGGLVMARYDRGLIEFSISALGLTGEERVLEVGFGPGVGIEVLASTASAVVGLDPSPVMHRQATHRNRAAIDDGTVTLVEGDATSMPLETRSFDVVLAINTVHHWPDIETGLDECRRVLRDRGTLAVATGTHVQESAGLDEYRLSALLEASGFTVDDIVRVDDGFVVIAATTADEPECKNERVGQRRTAEYWA